MRFLFNNLNQAIEQCTSSKSYGIFYSEKNETSSDIHIHNACEMFFCLSNGHKFLINNIIYDIKVGDIVVINPYEAHKIIQNPNLPFKRYVIMLDSSFLTNNSSSLTNLSYCFFNRKKASSHKLSLTNEDFIELIHTINLNGDFSNYGDDIIMTNKILNVLVFVNKKFQLNSTSELMSSFNSKTVENLIKYINENLENKLTLSTISEACFISSTQLEIVFKKNLGTTVNKYIMAKRITKAKKMLSENCSVTDVAFKCGFPDYTNFIRTFKKAVGISPGKYARTVHF